MWLLNLVHLFHEFDQSFRWFGMNNFDGRLSSPDLKVNPGWSSRVVSPSRCALAFACGQIIHTESLAVFLDARCVMTAADDTRLKAILDQNSNLFLDELAHWLSRRLLNIAALVKCCQLFRFDRIQTFIILIFIIIRLSLQCSLFRLEFQRVQITRKI